MQYLRPIDWKSSDYYACAFVSRENIDDYYCVLCDRRLRGDKDLCEHININERHTNYVRQRGCHLTPLENDKFYCSRCRCVIDHYTKIDRHFRTGNHFLETDVGWQQRKSKILDWIASDIFACPFVLRRENNQYYCLVCGFIAVDDRAYDEHIRGKFHRDSVLYNGQHISPIEDNAYYCHTCNRKLIYYTSIHTHLLGKNHKEKLQDAEKKKIPKPQPIEWASCEYFVRPFVTEAPNGKYYCVICEMSLGDKTILDNHIKGDCHTEAVKAANNFVFPLEHCYYYCECCNLILPYHHMIRSHIDGGKHRYLFKERAKLRKEKSIDHSANERFVCPFVSRESAGEYYCILCDFSILDNENLNRHLNEMSHTSAIKINGRYVKGLQDENFYCECCDRVIYDYRKIRDHLNEKKHISIREGLEREKRNEETSNTGISRGNNRGANNSKSTYATCLYSNASEKAVKTTINNETAVRKKRSEETKNSGITEVAKSNEKNYRGRNFASIKRASKGKDEAEVTEINLVVSPRESNGREELSEDTNNIAILEIAKTDEKNDIGTNSPSSEVTINLEDSGYEERPRKNITLQSFRTKSFRPKEKIEPREVAELMDYCEDIYDTQDRLREIKLGLEFCFVTEMSEYYCLICREIVGQTTDKYVEHLGDPDHCNYLEVVMKNHAQFEIDNNEFSELYLSHHYMVNISELLTRCIVCNEDINPVGNALNDHIDRDDHLTRCVNMRIKATENLAAIASRMECNWYKIERYRCETCSLTFDTEMKFASHMRSEEHDIFRREIKDTGEVPIYDFCELCALMWYGYRCTYAAHCKSLSHKWLARQGYYIPTKLPISTWKFLSKSAAYIGHTIDYLYDESEREKMDKEMLMNDLRLAIISKFPDVNVYTFGSREFGSKSPNQCIDVFIGCESIYDGKLSPDHAILDFMTIVDQCLKEAPEKWEPEDFCPIGHLSVIKARHRVTGKSFEIFFERGLSMDSTKLIGFYNDIFPQCQKLLLFLKQWLAHCDLSGHRRISCYALYWSIIFCLQKESILPSIASLMAFKENSLKIDGNPIGAFNNVILNESKANSDIKELIIRFFMFYACFDFRHDVASPSLGDTVKKRTFGYPDYLPNEMASYVDYVKTAHNPKPFEIECPMCLQDPLIHERNLTRDLSKYDLIRFRACCYQSTYSLSSF